MGVASNSASSSSKNQQPVADLREDAARGAEVFDETWSKPEGGLEGCRRVAGVAQRVLPEEAHLVKQQRGLGTVAQGSGLPLE